VCERDVKGFSTLTLLSVAPYGAPQQLTHRSRTAARTVCAFNPPQIGRRSLFAFRKSHSVTPILSLVFAPSRHTRSPRPSAPLSSRGPPRNPIKVLFYFSLVFSPYPPRPRLYIQIVFTTRIRNV